MTFVGKIFVMVNVVISLLMMAVAAGLYASGVDRTEKAAKDSDPGGVTFQRKAELKQLQNMIPPVENGWRMASVDLLTREGERQESQKWFQKELAHVRFLANAGEPARQIILDAGGLAVPDKAKPFLPAREEAKDRTGQPLLSIAVYTTQLKARQDENFAVLAKLDKAFQEDTRLTNRLVPPKPAKGLRDILVEERLKREGILFEYDSVERFFIKTRVEAAILRDRIGVMDDQIKSLQRTLSRLKSADGGKTIEGGKKPDGGKTIEGGKK